VTDLLLGIYSYYFAGLLYALACVPAVRRDAARLRRHGQPASISKALPKAFFGWPLFLFRRGHSRDEDPQTTVLPVITYHKPDYDKIAELERENGLD
jgi:hypothetical protein